MVPPLRKSKKQFSQEEIQYLITHYDSETVEFMQVNKTECDIPAIDKLEEKIENDFRVIKGKPLELYKKFIKLTDNFNKIYEKYMPCKRGCGKCCSIPVLINDLEKNIIKNYLNETNEIRKFVYSNEIKGSEPKAGKPFGGLIGEEYLGMECPFLCNNECSIYSVRPYKCRLYIIFDSDNSLCGSNNKRVIYGTHIYSEIVYDKIINLYYQRKNKCQKPYDIRDVFKKL